ncbi:MAG: DUF6691 family protein [Bradymonadaceae bacterium]
MIRQLLVLASGFLFALGLGIAEMTRPEKVLGFLDVAGHWDPSLAFVMGGAIVVYAIAFQIARRRDRPAFASHFRIPSRTDIDPPLLIGAATFGVGWGLAGFCPGPALVAGAAGLATALFFLPALVAGILAHRLLFTR